MVRAFGRRNEFLYGVIIVSCILLLFLNVGSSLEACAVEGSSSYQPKIDEVIVAFHCAGTNNLGSGYESINMPQIETGYPDDSLTSPSIPCVLLKAIGYVESSWHQAEHNVPRGQSGETLVTSSCGYGIMQITSGMHNPGDLDIDTQQMIAEDYKYNIGWGSKMLVDKWNLAPEYRPAVGNRDPSIVENWYYTVWSYNYWGWKNNPHNPNFPWPREDFNGTQDKTNYPYQELVWGYAANPPAVDEVPLWEAVPLTLPNRDEIDPFNPGWIETPVPSHQSACQLLQVSPGSLDFLVEPGGNSIPRSVLISNGGIGTFDWTASSSHGWLNVSPASGSNVPYTITVSVDASSMVTGTYTGTITVTADGVANSPQTVQSVVLVGPVTKSHFPVIMKD